MTEKRHQGSGKSFLHGKGQLWYSFVYIEEHLEGTCFAAKAGAEIVCTHNL
jgi:hypothetical protein